MYLLTEWEDRTGKYVARGHGVRTEGSEVRAPRLSVKYFPVRPDLTQSISILSYDHRAFPFFFFFRVIKFAIGMFTYVAHFDRKVGIYIVTKFFHFASRKEPNANIAGPDVFFRPCLCHRVRLSYGDFLNSFAMKSRARGRTGHVINTHTNPPEKV